MKKLLYRETNPLYIPQSLPADLRSMSGHDALYADNHQRYFTALSSVSSTLMCGYGDNGELLREFAGISYVLMREQFNWLDIQPFDDVTYPIIEDMDGHECLSKGLLAFMKRLPFAFSSPTCGLDWWRFVKEAYYFGYYAEYKHLERHHGTSPMLSYVKSVLHRLHRFRTLPYPMLSTLVWLHGLPLPDSVSKHQYPFFDAFFGSNKVRDWVASFGKALNALDLRDERTLVETSRAFRWFDTESIPLATNDADYADFIVAWFVVAIIDDSNNIS